MIPDKWSTSPPCTVNRLATLVEIQHLHTSIGTPGTSWDECGRVLPGNCDLTLNLDENITISCPGCYLHKIHTEIDMYWNSSRIAPMIIPANIWIDVQGFVYWDPDHVNDPGHSYSGWELHPFTAWRMSGATNTSVPVGVTVCPGTIMSVGGGVSQCSTTPVFVQYQQSSVGGTIVSVDKFTLLVPYLQLLPAVLAQMLTLATVHWRTRKRASSSVIPTQ